MMWDALVTAGVAFTALKGLQWIEAQGQSRQVRRKYARQFLGSVAVDAVLFGVLIKKHAGA